MRRSATCVGLFQPAVESKVDPHTNLVRQRLSSLNRQIAGIDTGVSTGTTRNSGKVCLTTHKELTPFRAKQSPYPSQIFKLTQNRTAKSREPESQVSCGLEQFHDGLTCCENLDRSPTFADEFLVRVHAEARIHRRVEILDGDRTLLDRYAQGSVLPTTRPP